MQFDEMADYGLAVWEHFYLDLESPAKAPMTVLGAPGIGKSEVARNISERMTESMRKRNPLAPEALFLALDLSSMLPEDLGGIPKTEMANINGTEMMVTTYAIQSWLAPFCAKGAYGVLCLDDLPAAAPAVQVATRQGVLYRRFGQMTLAPGVMLFVTGNRREDKSGASTLPAHFRNTVQIHSLEPNLEKWLEWYGRQPAHDPVVGAFLQYRPSHLSMLPKDAGPNGAFATPRAWALLGSMLPVAKRTGNVLDVATGLVSEGIAIELMAFINIRSELVDPASVLRDPFKAMPSPGVDLKTPDKMYAMTTGLGEVAAAWCLDTKRADRQKKTPELFMRALGHVCQGQREYISTGVKTFTNNGGNVLHLVSAARTNRNDKLIRGVCEFLAETFSA